MLTFKLTLGIIHFNEIKYVLYQKKEEKKKYIMSSKKGKGKIHSTEPEMICLMLCVLIDPELPTLVTNLGGSPLLI